MNQIKLAFALVAVATICACCAAHAQTATPSTPTISTNAVTVETIPNFFNQAAQWATTFNTNYSWTGISGQFEDGLLSQNNVGAADYIRGQYNIGNWNISLEGDFFGVGSAFNGVEGGAGYAFINKYDLKMEFNALIGGIKSSSTSTSMRFKAEPEIKLTKLMTANTYATISMGVPWIQSKTFDGTPEFRVGMGFSF